MHVIAKTQTCTDKIQTEISAWRSVNSHSVPVIARSKADQTFQVQCWRSMQDNNFDGRRLRSCRWSQKMKQCVHTGPTSDDPKTDVCDAFLPSGAVFMISTRTAV